MYLYALQLYICPNLLYICPNQTSCFQQHNSNMIALITKIVNNVLLTFAVLSFLFHLKIWFSMYTSKNYMTPDCLHLVRFDCKNYFNIYFNIDLIAFD